MIARAGRIAPCVPDCASHDASALFGIHAPQLSGIAGGNGNGALANRQTGRITWTFVPRGDRMEATDGTNGTDSIMKLVSSVAVNPNIGCRSERRGDPALLRGATIFAVREA